MPYLVFAVGETARNPEGGVRVVIAIAIAIAIAIVICGKSPM